MGGLGEKCLHLVYGKLKPSMITLPLIDQVTAGIVFQDLLILGERGNTVEIIQYMRRPDEHYASRYKLKTPSYINKIVAFKEKPGKSVKFILAQALGYIQVLKYTLNRPGEGSFIQDEVSIHNFKQNSLIQLKLQADIVDLITFKAPQGEPDLAFSLFTHNLEDCCLVFWHHTNLKGGALKPRDKHLQGHRVCCIQHVRDGQQFVVCIERDPYVHIYDRVLRGFILSVRNPSNGCNLYHSLQMMPLQMEEGDNKNDDSVGKP